MPLRSLFLSLVGFTLSTAASAQDLGDFPRSFRSEALAAGVSADTYDREMRSVRAIPRVMELNSNQPEFSRPIWEYLDIAVSDKRIADGRAAMDDYRTVLARTEEKYRVDKEVMGAIWGLESSYGQIMGDFDIVSALSTLAAEGRRQDFGKSQLIGALKIIDNGYATRQQLRGSWAGAMGMTQFIPTTYLEYAVDENGDGRRNLWQTHSDVFGSTANYLSRFGWKLDQPWGFEVSLPDGFDYGSASLSSRKTVGQWASMGVTAPSGELTDRVDLNTEASVIVPAGAAGPAFMVFDNFRTIMRYNNSTSYALGIGLLSDQLAGRGRPVSQPWPNGDRPLSLTERKTLQRTLAEKGYDPGPVDGIIGAGTKKALRAWQKANGMPADGYASARTLERLTS